MVAANHYFYVLSCQDHTYYGGYTVDLARRLAEHNAGKGAKYTHPTKRRPVAMIHAEHFDSRSAAMKAEAAFKRLSRVQKEQYLKEYRKKSVL
ncbi:GIY-YIG nuclease family protein [Enterococcus pallens]|mgnify:CR=1 FL=1|uniref:GIY-YIG nuclease superfamily protein n=1 Tax=Enterococcus pallens ATCC BAA-351 TaxID=1158607 RepID=R2S4R3_9ENTE|nr:GIY-YIG nuclease family protein [Enterococcus pallens]EOH87891.1 GIY-YIG nuclease superfamily protein [Enterococcus pallens ATCC BAA-351]EOU18105.1 GIY-YIG nuclease superfamily protein [Enterococcus pallens ATCC BAA-351]